MPQALSFLGIDSMDEEAPDWATLAVYTCARSCPPTPPLADGGGDLADPPTAESAEALAAVGHTARLQGLKSRPELNGTTCIVLNWIPDAARWAVHMHAYTRTRVRAYRWAVHCESSGKRLEARAYMHTHVREYVQVGGAMRGQRRAAQSALSQRAAQANVATRRAGGARGRLCRGVRLGADGQGLMRNERPACCCCRRRCRCRCCAWLVRAAAPVAEA